MIVEPRLIEAMAEADLDMLLVYGNAWQVDYLRYATDFGILEGQALALVRNDGHITLYLDSTLEVDRAELDCSGVDVIYAPDLIAEVDHALNRLRNHRIGTEGLTPALKAARTAFSLPVVNEPVPSAVGFSFARLDGIRPRRSASVVTATNRASISALSSRFSAPARSLGKNGAVASCSVGRPEARAAVPKTGLVWSLQNAGSA